MRKNIFLFVLGCVLLLGVGSCAAEPPKPPAATAGPDFKPVATIKDIMDGLVDPSADDLWQSVATIIDINGITERYPRTDEEWKKVRGYALTLVEAPNLLMIPRQVAKPGEKSENPGIELQPEEIQALVDKDRVTFGKLALCLQETALAALQAIDAKDKDRLSDVGGAIDHACEQCHLRYWYPNEAKGKAADEAGKSCLAGESQVPPMKTDEQKAEEAKTNSFKGTMGKAEDKAKTEKQEKK